MLKKTFILNLLVVVCCLSVGTNVGWAVPIQSLGWWDEGASGSTHQFWDFCPSEVELDGIWWDWNAYPHTTDNPGTSVAHIAAGLYDSIDAWSMHAGFLDSERIDVMLEISNFKNPNKYKEIWVDVWYVGELTNIDAEGFGPLLYTTVGPLQPLPGSDAVFGFRIYPNPDKEHVEFSIVSTGGMAGLLEMHVDTICIPEPATIALLGIGALSLLHRRKK